MLAGRVDITRKSGPSVVLVNSCVTYNSSRCLRRRRRRRRHRHRCRGCEWRSSGVEGVCVCICVRNGRHRAGVCFRVCLQPAHAKRLCLAVCETASA